MTDEEYKEQRRMTFREAQRKRRLNARKNGLCQVCCMNEIGNGYKLCLKCRMKISQRRNEVKK